MPRVAVVVCLLLTSGYSLTARAGSETAMATGPDRAPHGWVFADVPLLDFGDDGRPLRVTVALPSQPCPVTRMLFASEARWALSAGYARVFDSYDPATGTFKNPGGHAAMVGAARQFRWHPPPDVGPTIPKLVIEFGANYATRRFPADGTRVNLLLVTGFEWTWRPPGPGPEWIAALVWPHFSNANLFARNAGYDGLALRLGRSLRF